MNLQLNTAWNRVYHIKKCIKKKVLIKNKSSEILEARTRMEEDCQGLMFPAVQSAALVLEAKVVHLHETWR